MKRAQPYKIVEGTPTRVVWSENVTQNPTRKKEKELKLLLEGVCPILFDFSKCRVISARWVALVTKIATGKPSLLDGISDSIILDLGVRKGTLQLEITRPF